MAEKDGGRPRGEAAPDELIEELRQELGVPAHAGPLGGAAAEAELPAEDPTAIEARAAETASAPSLDQLVAAIDREVAAVGLDQSQEAPAAPAGTGEARHIVFTLGATRYAVAVGNVVEIGRAPELTRVPNLPAWVLGVSNLRGDIFAVLDLRALLGLEVLGPIGEGRMLVARAGGEEVSAGLIVDQVNGVAGISMVELAPPTAPIDDRLAPYLVGVEERQDRLLVVLDLERLLMSEEIRQFELQ